MTQTRLFGVCCSAALLALAASVAGAGMIGAQSGQMATLGMAFPPPGSVVLAIAGSVLFLARKRVFERK